MYEIARLCLRRDSVKDNQNREYSTDVGRAVGQLPAILRLPQPTMRRSVVIVRLMGCRWKVLEECQNTSTPFLPRLACL